MTGSRMIRYGARMERIFWLSGIVCMLFAALPGEQTAWFVLSAAAHELGHIAAMHLLGMHVRGMHAAAGGAVLRWDSAAVSYRQELFCAAAGPAVNLLLAMCFCGWKTAFAVNVLLAVYNLLPLRGNDGAVMLSAVFSHLGCGRQVNRVLSVIGTLLSALLLMLGAWLFWYGALQDTHGDAIGYGTLFCCLLLRILGDICADNE